MNGSLRYGVHTAPGVDPLDAMTEWNSTAIQFLQSNLDTTKATAAAAKHANRIISGR